MNAPTIAVIGAASTTFGPKVLRDVINHPELDGSTLRLVDIDAEHLEITARLARRLCEHAGRAITVEATEDRRDALPGADYVLVSVEVDHYKLWKQDFSIPVKHGVRQVTGELGGPGGMFHAFRQIPIHLEIARDIETLCPNAIVMVESNPLNRICLAMRRHTRVGEILGLCHGVEISQNYLGGILGFETDDLVATAAGVNHFTWILDLRLKATGEDLYPTLRQKLAQHDPSSEPLCRKLLEVYGYYPAPGDAHIGEYLACAADFVGLDGPPLDDRDRWLEERWEYLARLSRGEELAAGEGVPGGEERQEELRLTEFLAPRSWVDTLAFPIMSAIRTNELRRMPAVNVLNRGAIENLPRDVFVEVPAVVDSAGVHPIGIGELPKALAAFCRRDIDQMELIVEAAVTGDRRAALQAMLLDPVIDSVRVAEQVLEEMLRSQAAYLPQFA